MTIRIRLAMGFGIIILAMISITAFALFQMGQIKARVDSIVDVSSRKVVLAQKLKIDILNVNVHEKNILLAGSQSDARQLILNTERLSSEVSGSITQLKHLTGEEHQLLLADLTSAWYRYLDISSQANQLAIQETYKQAGQLSQGVGLQSFDKALSQLGGVLESNFAARSVYKNSPSLLEKLAIEQTLIQGLESNLFSMQEIEQKLLHAKSSQNINQYIDSINNIELSIKEQISQLKANPVPLNRDAFGIVDNAVRKFLQNNAEVRRLIELNPKLKANQLLSTEGEDALSDVNRLLNDIIARSEYVMTQDKSQSSIAHSQTQRLVLGVLIVIGITCVLISYFLSHSIIFPLRKLNNATRALAGGDTSVRSDIQSSNEVGELAKAFNHMAGLIHQRVELQTGLNQLATSMRGDQDPGSLAQNIIDCLSDLLKAQVAAFYFYHDDKLQRAASHAIPRGGIACKTISLGEGLIGQSALDKTALMLNDIPEGHLNLELDSGIGHSQIKSLIVQPLLLNNQLSGIMVFASVHNFHDNAMAFLKDANENLAISLQAAKSRARQSELLEATQRQAELLHEQQENLKRANREMEESKLLLENKAEELDRASRYKSDFLANMSHELRSPLNSMLLLSKTLSRNSEGNLNSDQVDSLNYIHSGGQELLSHINDILDLSKVEAGKLDFHFETLDAVQVCRELEVAYQPQVIDKNIGFELNIEEGIQRHICSDKKRIVQILRNLISNAIKFTHSGKIVLGFHTSKTKWPVEQGKSPSSICFSVKDTGIGISKGKFQAIFEAFQQADGSTSRKYGGTGLGLTISKEFSKKLEGEIHVSSNEGEGSEFILLLPLQPEGFEVSFPENSERHYVAAKDNEGELYHRQNPDFGRNGSTTKEIKHEPKKVGDNEEKYGTSDEKATILVIEDDPGFSKVLMQHAHNRNLKCITASEGKAGIELARKLQPHAITLDIGLPESSGIEVLETLKGDVQTKDIPVYIISSYDDTPEIREKIHSYLTKPVTDEEIADLFLLIEKDISQHPHENDIDVSSSPSLKEVHPPLVSDQSNEPFVEKSRQSKTLLLVDDDIRNMFALSKILINEGYDIIKADNGELALSRVREALENGISIDAILMDIMMPVMDGYEAIRQIRALGDQCTMPIIALTAKAMQGDREKCLEMGADDYMTKPLDELKLLELLDKWLHIKPVQAVKYEHTGLASHKGIV